MPSLPQMNQVLGERSVPLGRCPVVWVRHVELIFVPHLPFGEVGRTITLNIKVNQKKKRGKKVTFSLYEQKTREFSSELSGTW